MTYGLNQTVFVSSPWCSLIRYKLVCMEFASFIQMTNASDLVEMCKGAKLELSNALQVYVCI